MANLSYIRNFCFSHSSKDELSYCLSTFEAAVKYINLGKLQDTHTVSVSHTHTHIHTWCLSNVGSPQHSGSLNEKVYFKARLSLLDQNAAPIHSLFQVSLQTKDFFTYFSTRMTNFSSFVCTCCACFVAHSKWEQRGGGTFAE